jgi:hypothetical protein
MTFKKVNMLFDQGEAEAAPMIIFCKTLEHLEDVMVTVLRYPDAIVGNRDLYVIADFTGLYPDKSLPLVW